MGLIRNSTLILACLLALGGCGEAKLLRTEGRLLKGGDDFIPEDGEYIQITFVPIPKDGEFATDYYYAEVDQDLGTFRPAGKNGKGMPSGKYRVAVELMKNRKDQFGGRFDTVQSPFVFDVDASTDEIVIDLDQPPAAA